MGNSRQGRRPSEAQLGAMTPPAEPRDAPEEALADALRHVLADAFALAALADMAAWNLAAAPDLAAYLRRRAAAARRAQAAVARQLRRLGRPAALHISDPSEVPRWMLASGTEDALATVLTLAAGTAEFAASVEAAVEVARDVPDAPCMGALGRMARRRRREVETLRALAEALARARLGAGRLN